ncbi:hypothetical protein H0V99_02095 [Candidatus Saccharibacteria bacterium]|nr:hypothetical protein [Candidatus Saccharibacteria bacterium]
MRHRHNQRSQLPANRELRQGINHRAITRSFGIRRLLDEESASRIRVVWDDLQEDNDIPGDMVARPEPGVTLLPMWHLGNQMKRGIVLGYKLGKANADFEHDEKLSTTTSESVEATLGKILVHKRRAIYVEVESAHLDEEERSMYRILGNIGYKGANRRIGKPHHITIGDAAPGFKLSLTEEKHIKGLSPDVFQGETVMLEQWNIYPDQSQTKQFVEIVDDF